MNGDDSSLRAEYDRLRARLGQLGWISHGYVQDRGPGAGGPCYQWTRKVKAKTVSVALSKEQYLALKESHRKLARSPGTTPRYASALQTRHL